MIILISLTLLFGIGILSSYKGYSPSVEVAGMILTTFSGIFLVICLVSLLINPMEVESNINKFLATKATIEKARRINYERIDKLSDIETINIQKIGTIIENTAVQHKIIESNQWLAKEQYYNSTVFGLWIPDKIDDLKPIK